MSDEVMRSSQSNLKGPRVSAMDTKFSPAQAVVMAHLFNGGQVHYWHGRISDGAFLDDPNRTRVRPATVLALHRKGMLKAVDKDWRRSIYVKAEGI